MWLNGLNNNLPGYPKVTCEMVDCPKPYMGPDQPGAPPDPKENLQDPFGSGGESFVRYGLCPIDQKNPDENQDMKILAYAKLNAYDKDTHGHFFWNFRTEVCVNYNVKNSSFVSFTLHPSPLTTLLTYLLSFLMVIYCIIQFFFLIFYTFTLFTSGKEKIFFLNLFICLSSNMTAGASVGLPRSR